MGSRSISVYSTRIPINAHDVGVHGFVRDNEMLERIRTLLPAMNADNVKDVNPPTK